MDSQDFQDFQDLRDPLASLAKRAPWALQEKRARRVSVR